MTQNYTIAGDGTVTLSNHLTGSEPRTLANLANQSAILVSFPNETGTMETMKGGAVFAINVAAKMATLTLRVKRASDDDAWLNTKLNNLLNNGVPSIALQATVIGNFGDGTGVLRKLTATLAFGFVKKRVDLNINFNGEVDQAIAEYQIDFGNSQLNFN